MVHNLTHLDENKQLEEYGNFESVIKIAIPIVCVFITFESESK